MRNILRHPRGGNPYAVYCTELSGAISIQLCFSPQSKKPLWDNWSMPRHSIHVLPGYCRESDYLIPLSHRPAHLCDKQQRGRLLKVPFQSYLALSEQLIAPREVGSERQKKKKSLQLPLVSFLYISHSHVSSLRPFSHPPRFHRFLAQFPWSKERE